MFSVQYTSSFVRVEVRLLKFKSSKLGNVYKHPRRYRNPENNIICVIYAYSDNSSLTFFLEDLTNDVSRNVGQELPLHAA